MAQSVVGTRDEKINFLGCDLFDNCAGDGGDVRWAIAEVYDVTDGDECAARNCVNQSNF